MEYCGGGSVYKMLEDPVNMYGLLEDEFLVFLRDISTSSSDAIYGCHISRDIIVISPRPARCCFLIVHVCQFVCNDATLRENACSSCRETF